MDRLLWNSNYSVNNSLLDSQHQRIFILINDLINQLNQHTEEYTLASTLAKLTNYSLEHFEVEEKIFDKTNYPDKENHKKLHALYNLKIQEFISNKNQDSKDELMKKILEFIQMWWTHHIQGTDKSYSEYINVNST
jgi:hemerythrin